MNLVDDSDPRTQIEQVIHSRPLAESIVQSIAGGLSSPWVHLSGRTIGQVFQHSLQAAIRDIEHHPRGRLFRRLLEYGPPDPGAPGYTTRFQVLVSITMR